MRLRQINEHTELVPTIPPSIFQKTTAGSSTSDRLSHDIFPLLKASSNVTEVSSFLQYRQFFFGRVITSPTTQHDYCGIVTFQE